MYIIIKVRGFVRSTRTSVNIIAVPLEWMVALCEDLFEAEMTAATLSAEDSESVYVVVATPEAERFEAGKITALAKQGYLTLRW